MNVVIVGGGASGLTASIIASYGNHQVTILEKNNKCGKKLLMTGNGKCNYFNNDFTIRHYHSSNIDLLATIINDSSKTKILNFFDSLGLVGKIKNNYFYPVTNQALTVNQLLIRKARSNGVNIQTNIEVINIKYDGKYHIFTNNGEYEADILVLSTGSKAYPITGANGFGYECCKAFNHHIVKPLPALVQLKSNFKYCHEWNGLRCDVILALYINDELWREEQGEIQLTDYGISGIALYQLSSHAVRCLDRGDKVDIKINFLPWLKESVSDYLNKRNNLLLDNNISELLDGMLHYKISNILLKKNNIPYEARYDQLSSQQKNNLFNDLTNFKLMINDYNGYDKAQVCSGGVPLTEINIETMASLKQENLYLIGELLDVDGECGGYNLGFAWLSGILAGMDIRGKK